MALGERRVSTVPSRILVGLERFALKVELDVPASCGRSPPLLWQRQRAGTSRSTLRQARSSGSL